MPLSQEFLDRVATAAVAEGAADAAFAEVGTPIGNLLVVETERGLCRVAFEEEDRDLVLAHVAEVIGPRLLRSARETAPLRDAVEAYFEDPSHPFDLPVDLSLVRSDFRRKVLKKLARVPVGRVTTYGQLASSTGYPRAARAVGTACATNPVPLVVPCHRVVPSSGGIGNYGGGVDRKRWLLSFEGALAE